MAAIKKEEQSYTANLNVDDIHTILGPESSFEGKLVFNNGTVRIDGTFRGEIRTANTLIIGETAHVEATVEAGTLVVTGEVIGDVKAKRSVAIEKPGRLRGTIITPELMIEKGVVFEGSCKMEEAAREGAGSAKVTLLTNPSKDDTK